MGHGHWLLAADCLQTLLPALSLDDPGKWKMPLLKNANHADDMQHVEMPHCADDGALDLVKTDKWMSEPEPESGSAQLRQLRW
ncbi:hypothetical protein ACLKA7_009340 [Drosophila subpalustris]